MEYEEILLLLVGLESAQDWWQIRCPQLLGYWMEILGKIDPNEQDQGWSERWLKQSCETVSWMVSSCLK